MALEAVNKCKCWRQRRNRRESADKDFTLSPRAIKAGEFYISPCLEF